MFSVRQKRAIADAVQQILRATAHPELPDGEIQFTLSVAGAEPWSWAHIQNNGAVPKPTVNPHNEVLDGGATFQLVIQDDARTLINASLSSSYLGSWTKEEETTLLNLVKANLARQQK